MIICDKWLIALKIFSKGYHLSKCPSMSFVQMLLAKIPCWCHALVQVDSGIWYLVKWSCVTYTGAKAYWFKCIELTLIQVTSRTGHLQRFHCPLAKVHGIDTHPSNILDWSRDKALENIDCVFFLLLHQSHLLHVIHSLYHDMGYYFLPHQRDRKCFTS